MGGEEATGLWSAWWGGDTETVEAGDEARTGEDEVVCSDVKTGV